jgi:hypothetical protein
MFAEFFFGNVVAALGTLSLCLIGLLTFAIRSRQMHLWLPSYLWPTADERRSRSKVRRRVAQVLSPSGHPVEKLQRPLNVFIAICDHFEPRNNQAEHATAIARVDRWCAEYPRLFDQFRDSDGRPPQHTMFFPQDEYHPEYLDRIAEFVSGGWGDVEIHLHHDGDTADSLREKLVEFRDTLFHRHGLLRRDPNSGAIVYGFIHGNWALCNCRPDGRWCGVDQELTVLRETGCYADFTLPSAPTDTQTSTINSIYYAADLPGRRKSHDRGVRACVGREPPRDHLLMIQGPLELDWQRRKFGLLPRIENGDIHAGFAPNAQRLSLWLKAGVHVLGRPEWLFVKLHTHGCKAGNIDTLLGEPTARFHRELAAVAARHPQFRYHYVTAWEMAQLVHAAERCQDWTTVLHRNLSLTFT